VSPVEGPRCVAPLGDVGRLCGEDAVTERLVEGILCPLCAAHAAELDEETGATAPEGDQT
jgi:hypothetical protein